MAWQGVHPPKKTLRLVCCSKGMVQHQSCTAAVSAHFNAHSNLT